MQKNLKIMNICALKMINFERYCTTAQLVK